jgi:type III pantothenate kinase
MFARLEPGALCLLSGGAAASLSDRLGVPLRVVENLVLEGLARIAAERL